MNISKQDSTPAFTLPLTVQLNRDISAIRKSSRSELCISRRRHRQIVGCVSSNGVSSNGTPPALTPDQLHPSWNVYHEGEDCVVCQGEGKLMCLFCFGEGSIVIGAQASRDTIECPQCMGERYEICCRCEGTGKRPLTRYDPTTKTELPNVTNADLRKPKKKLHENHENEELAATTAQS